MRKYPPHHKANSVTVGFLRNGAPAGAKAPSSAAPPSLLLSTLHSVDTFSFRPFPVPPFKNVATDIGNSISKTTIQSGPLSALDGRQMF